MEKTSVTNWNLKSNLAAFNEGYLREADLPTANLLGWKPAAILSISQRQNLYLSGITPYDFEVTDSQFQLNPKLMKIVYKYLQANSQATGDFRITSTSESVNYGAPEKLGWLRRSGEPEDPFAKTVASVERNMYATMPAIPSMGESSRKLSEILGFRIDKKETMDWAIYSWNDYKYVPECWNKTTNSVFEFGNISPDAEPCFRLYSHYVNHSDSYLDRDGYRAQFLEYFF